MSGADRYPCIGPFPEGTGSIHSGADLGIDPYPFLIGVYPPLTRGGSPHIKPRKLASGFFSNPSCEHCVCKCFRIPTHNPSCERCVSKWEGGLGCPNPRVKLQACFRVFFKHIHQANIVFANGGGGAAPPPPPKPPALFFFEPIMRVLCLQMGGCQKTLKTPKP